MKKGETWKPRFLAMYVRTGNIGTSCKAAGISRQTYYHAYKHSPVFHDTCNEARELMVDNLELQARKQAQHSVYMMRFLLASYHPDAFANERTDVYFKYTQKELEAMSDEKLETVFDAVHGDGAWDRLADLNDLAKERKCGIKRPDPDAWEPLPYPAVQHPVVQSSNGNGATNGGTLNGGALANDNNYAPQTPGEETPGV